MAKLLVGAPLSTLFEPQPAQDRDDLARAENRKPAHRLGGHSLSTDVLTLELRLPVLQEHRDDFVKIRVELVERAALGVCPGKPRDMADEETGVWVALDDGGVRLHSVSAFGWVRQ